MAKTHPVPVTDTFSAKNISSAASVYAYTVTTTGYYWFTVNLTNAAGNGDYIIYATRAWLGVSTDTATCLGKSTYAAATGETNIEFNTGLIFCVATDVVNIMVDGLAGDTSVNGKIRISRDNPSVVESTDIISDGTAFPGAYIDAAISSVGGLGAGSISWTITITVDGNPRDGVDVWVTTDSAGNNVIARGDTDDSGEVAFMLDAGTYYAWKQLAGVSFTNPETFTVS